MVAVEEGKFAPRTSKSRKIVGGVIALGVVLLAVLLWRSDKTFPGLPVGSYMGQATGLSSDKSEQTTLYIERVAGAHSLLVVVFREGWRPQAVQIRQANPGPSGKDDPGVFQPIAVKAQDQSYELSGSDRGGEYSGYVQLAGKRVGTWNLVPMQGKLEQPDTTDAKSVVEWMSLKSKFRTYQRELEALNAVYLDKTQKQEKLQQYIQDETKLRERARARLESMSKDVKKTTDEKVSIEKQVDSLVGNLGVVNRISKRGQAVALARRVSNRENKWYLANWRVEEDRSGLDEYLGSGINVDMKKVDSAYTKASELKALVREVSEQKRKIAELEQVLLRGPTESAPADVEPVPADEPRPQRRDKKSLWDDLWG